MKDRNENRPGYKKTKVGWIPQEWRCLTISDVLDCVIDYRGKAPNKAENGIPLITARNIREGYIDFNSGKEFIPHDDYEEWMCRGIPQTGDVLFTTEAPLGNAAMFPEQGKYALAQRVVTLRCSQATLIGKYLLYYVLSSNGHNSVCRLSTGSTALGIKQRTLKTVLIPLPSLIEQKKIAEILSTWDESIEQMRNLIDAKKRRKKALMQQLLTGKKRFKDNGGNDWRIRSLGELVEPVSRPIPKPKEPYLSIRIRSHGKGTFQKTVEQPEKVMMETLYRLDHQDIVVNITFAWEGAIAIATERDKGGLVSHRFPTYRFREKEADINFFRNLFLTKRFVWDLGLISPGGAGRNRVMNKKDFLKLKVLSPNVKMQREIGKILTTADNEIKALEDYRNALERQKRGLMQKLLTGEMRISV